MTMATLEGLEDTGRTDPEQINPTLDTHVFLLGRPPLTRFLDFVEDLAVNGRAADVKALTEEWHTARALIRHIAKEELGWVDKPPIGPLPSRMIPLRDQLFKDPVFQHSFNKVGTVEVGMVELDRLVVYQKHIDLAHVQRLKQKLGPSPSEEEIFKLCLPFEHPQPLMRWMKPTSHTYVFISPSNDLRYLESTMLTSKNLIDFPPPGAICGVVGVVVGFGSNFFNVIHAEDRLVVHNGSHRAFTLRDLGITHAPCIIRHVTNREELRAVTSSDLRRNPDLYLKHPRPSILKDYFDPRLRKLIDVPRRLYQVTVKFDVESIDIPAM